MSEVGKQVTVGAIGPSLSVEERERLRHPRERRVTTAVAIIDVVLVVAILGLLVLGAEWLTDNYVGQYKGHAKLLLLAVLSAPLVASYLRSRRRKLAQEESIRVSETQLPEIHHVLLRHCARLGVPVPELYVSDIIERTTTFMWRRHYCIIVCTHEFSFFPEAFEDIIDWVLAREMGSICLGYASYRSEMLGSFVAPIPFLRAPLNHIKTYSRDRYGALLAPRAIRALIVVASGDRLRNEVNLDMYLKQLDEIKEHGFWISAIWPLRKTVPLAYRVRELRRANMLMKC